MIYLPETRPHHVLTTRLGIYLFNWIFWYVPAFVDTFASDVGPDYRAEVTIWTIAATILVGTCIIAGYNAPEVTWHTWLPSAVVAYLGVGICYHVSMRKWRGH